MRRNLRARLRLAGHACYLTVALGLGLGTFSSPVAAQICVGDCDRDGQVTMAELVTAVNVALGHVQPAVCEAFDATPGRVRVGTLVRAVLNAIDGCRTARLIRTQILASSLRASLANLFYLTFETPIPVVPSLTCDNGAIATFGCDVAGGARAIEIELQRCGGGYRPEIGGASDDQVTGTLTWISPGVGCEDMVSLDEPVTLTFSGIVERPGSESFFRFSDVELELLFNDALGSFDTAVSGLVESSCVSGQQMVSGSMDIGFNPQCPQSGALALMRAESPSAPLDTALFTPTGVEIDLETDGTIEAEFPACNAPSIEVCPGF